MGVYINGMEMPTSCSECAFCGYYGKGDHMCDITGKDVVYELSLENRLDDCPLIELPAQHGRLIDADALKDSLIVEYPSVTNAINYAPTVIGAESEDV